MRDFMVVAKALADENRVRALLALRQRELCVCQIIALLELAPSTVSKHMAILQQARLVDSRKVGRWVYYRLADASAGGAVAGALDWIQRTLDGNPKTRADDVRLKKILRLKPETLCKRQADNR